MSCLHRYRVICAFALIILAPACANLNSGNTETTTVPAYDPYAQSGIDELLAFGASMAGMPVQERADLCQSLINAQKLSPSDGKQLHLMVGRLLSDACGDIPGLLTDIEAVRPAYANDERVQRLIAIHVKALQRIQYHAQKCQPPQPKARKRKPAAETKETAPEPEKDEARLLREKLEAIRSIEKQMDESTESP